MYPLTNAGLGIPELDPKEQGIALRVNQKPISSDGILYYSVCVRVCVTYQQIHCLLQQSYTRQLHGLDPGPISTIHCGFVVGTYGSPVVHFPHSLLKQYLQGVTSPISPYLEDFCELVLWHPFGELQQVIHCRDDAVVGTRLPTEVLGLIAYTFIHNTARKHWLRQRDLVMMVKR